MAGNLADKQSHLDDDLGGWDLLASDIERMANVAPRDKHNKTGAAVRQRNYADALAPLS